MPDSVVRLPAVLAPSSRRGMAQRVAIAVALWAASFALSIALEEYIQRTTFIFFWLAVLGAAWWSGFGFAVAAALAAVLAINWLFVPPAHEFNFSRLGSVEAIQLTIFLTVAMAMSLLLDRLESARGRLLQERALQDALNQQLREQAAALEGQAGLLEDQAMELERQNEELQVLADEATAANRAKAEFLATMSHELRTPINAAMGYVDLLEAGIHGPLTQPQREDLVRIRRSQRRLLTLVTDVLSFARLESARLELHLEPVALDALLPELEESVEPLARARSVGYRCTSPAAPLLVHADRDRLEQVLLNLLGNAVKFTEAGGEVTVHAERRDGHAFVHVRDTGRGIPADKLDVIFEPFVQAEQGLTRSAEGTGLGLAISRGLARAMGGDVSVASRLGEGSTFTVRVPLAHGG